MKISKLNIEIKDKFFLRYDGLNLYKKQLEKHFKEFLDNNSNLQIIDSGEIRDVYADGKKKEGLNNYSGYFVKYYEGLMVIEGNNISMTTNLNKSIIDLALKQASGEIKELVKKEYQEFENQLIDLIEKTEKKNIFGNFVARNFSKLRKAILESNKKYD